MRPPSRLLRCRFSAAICALRETSTLQTKNLFVIRTPAKHATAYRRYGTAVRGSTPSDSQDEVSASRLFRASQGQLPLSDSQRRTIYALSTPPGKGGVGIVRISGPEALQVWKAVVRRGSRQDEPGSSGPTPWRMYRCKVTHPTTGEVLDDGLAVYFKGSFIVT